MANIILGLGLLYFFAHLLAISFDRTRVPDVLVLTVVGILVGPALGWVAPEAFGEAGHVLTTLALAVILFEGGTTLDLPEIGRSARHTLQVTLSTVAATILLVGVGAHLALDLSWMNSFLVGTIVSGTSPAVVIPMVRSLKVRENASTLMTLESALADVVSIVLTFALIEAATQGQIHIGETVGRTLSALVFATVIGIAGGLGWLLVWDRVRRLPSTIFTTLAGAFILYGLAELLGFSGPIAVLAFGVTLANHQHVGLPSFFSRRPLTGVRPTESEFYGEIVFLLKTFFFVYLGISMRFDSPGLLLIALALTVLVYLARFLLTARLAPEGATRREAVIISLMIPKGLAAAVLAGLPAEAGIPEGQLMQDLVYGLVLASILVTASLVAIRDTPLVASLFDRVMSRYSPSAPNTTATGTPVVGIPPVR